MSIYKDIVEGYQLNNIQEKDKLNNVLVQLNEKDDQEMINRKNFIGHFTASAFVISKDNRRLLMVHHNIYNTWSWTGGHADGEADLLKVAIKEAKEETSVENIGVLDENIIAIDILPVVPHVKRGKFISGHLHFCISYALIADENSHIEAKLDENSGVKWIKIDELEKYSDEPYLIGVYRKIHKRVVMSKKNK